MLSHLSVQIAFPRVPPEVETHTFRIDKTQVKAVWIALNGFGTVSRVDKSKSTLRPLFTTQAAINSWKFELKTAENYRTTDEIHMGISINILLHCLVLGNPSSVFFSLQYWNRTIDTCLAQRWSFSKLRGVETKPWCASLHRLPSVLHPTNTCVVRQRNLFS